MSVWYCVPSVRPLDEAEPVLAKWRQKGYRLAILREGEPIAADLIIYTKVYLGMPQSINRLVGFVLGADPEAEWLIFGNDDIEPDPYQQPAMIAEQCGLHFGTGHGCVSTFGVMQPTGDRWNEGSIDTAAASAWMGREWCRTMYGGKGPVCEEYRHYYCDTELQEVAIYRKSFWQRRDIVQQHNHWSRYGNPLPPQHLKELCAGPVFEKDRDTFLRRRVKLFPGHAPLDGRRARA